MNDETSTFPVTQRVARLLFRAAGARGILRGRREAILARLEELGRDLFPRGAGFFAALFAAGEGPDQSDPAPRDIGDAFWREAFASLERRRLEGSYYTPLPVIDRILDLVRDDLFPGGRQPDGDGRTLCDPAMGCGFFLLRAAERLLARHPGRRGAVRDWAANRLFGVDLDAGAVFMARALLWLTLSDANAEFVPRPNHFRQGESLLGPPFGAGLGAAGAAGLDWAAAFPAIAAAGGFDVVAGNPPYEVLTNFARRPERKRLALAIRDSGFYRDALSGQINLHRCFIERSLDLLRPGGALSLIVPLSFARDAAALPLRKRLIEEHAAGDWILYGERDKVFPGVTQSACVFRAVKGAGPAESLNLASDGETGTVPAAELARAGGGAMAIPALNGGGASFLRWLGEHCRGRLEDAAAMRVGEVDQTVYRDCMLDRDSGCLLARGAHLSPFRLDLAPIPDKARFLDLPRFLAMKGASAEACRERAEQWRVVQLGIRNLHSRPRLVAALAPPGVYLGNSLNVYFPKDGLPIEFLAGLLNARLLDWLFRLSSGNNNINLREMRHLPFPDHPAPEGIRAVTEAYRRSAETAAGGGGAAELAAARDALDAEVERFYGVPEELLEEAGVRQGSVTK